jgi:hypothetical protein
MLAHQPDQAVHRLFAAFHAAHEILAGNRRAPLSQDIVQLVDAVELVQNAGPGPTDGASIPSMSGRRKHDAGELAGAAAEPVGGALQIFAVRNLRRPGRSFEARLVIRLHVGAGFGTASVACHPLSGLPRLRCASPPAQRSPNVILRPTRSDGGTGYSTFPNRHRRRTEMKKTVATLAAAALAAPAAALAGTGTILHAYQYVEVRAAPQKVWEAVSSFGGIQRWHPEVRSSRMVEGADGETGSIREVQYRDGTTVRDELTRYERRNMRMDYQMVGGTAWGVKDYNAVIDVVEPRPGVATVIWRGSFVPARTTGNQGDDIAAIQRIENKYRTGLENLKTQVERG